MLNEVSQEQLTELVEQEKSKDEVAVEDFLTTVTSSSLYYKGMRDESLAIGDTTLENHLSEDQIKLLLSDKYLDVGVESEPLRVYNERKTTIPNVSIYLYPGKEHNLHLSNIGTSKDYKPSSSPFINGLINEYNLRRSSMEKRATFLAEKVEKFGNQWMSQMEKDPELYETVSNFDLPAIQAFYLSTLWNRTMASRTGEVTDSIIKEVTLEASQLYENEKVIHKGERSVGCEVEIPYTGHFNAKRVSPAKYVFFPEHLELLESLEIPIETDKQGEAAIPPSKSPLLQFKILEQLTQMGFTPKEAMLRYTMHVNVSLSETELKSLGFDAENSEENPRLENTLPVLGYAVGGRYSSEARLLQGAYAVPINIKGHNEESFRLEFRALEFNPGESEEDFVSKINSIKKTVNLFMEYYTSDRPESTRYGKFLTRLAQETIDLADVELPVIEAELSKNIESIIADENKREKLKNAFDELVSE
ncbi:hypothetical protein C4561_04980 [candidate division WWE3 bacterium]|jgi:hypothetical protein|uniref:Uncharacterized protein n=1 Tax=candidate division WWE3 bacterium TaxID=2053526 RepID=A0A3A4ZIV3_UNCKA|nr:MAG: hypothetical protein C4561_04980 [candidate division WWE3 bacterium]